MKKLIFTIFLGFLINFNLKSQELTVINNTGVSFTIFNLMGYDYCSGTPEWILPKVTTTNITPGFNSVVVDLNGTINELEHIQFQHLHSGVLWVGGAGTTGTTSWPFTNCGGTTTALVNGGTFQIVVSSTVPPTIYNLTWNQNWNTVTNKIDVEVNIN